MATQDFELLVESGLLALVEQIVVTCHRDLYVAQEKPWSRHIAYRWLRYEDPAPVARLAAGTSELLDRGANLDAEAVDKACAQASNQGFSS